MKILKSFNVQIWCGLKETYNDEKIHSLETVRNLCDNHYLVTNADCVTITETEFRYVDGFEKGVVIGWIQYPRFPRTEDVIKEKAIKFANILMTHLNQYRVTITTPYESIMLENENVER